MRLSLSPRSYSEVHYLRPTPFSCESCSRSTKVLGVVLQICNGLDRKRKCQDDPRYLGQEETATSVDDYDATLIFNLCCPIFLSGQGRNLGTHEDSPHGTQNINTSNTAREIGGNLILVAQREWEELAFWQAEHISVHAHDPWDGIFLITGPSTEPLRLQYPTIIYYSHS